MKKILFSILLVVGLIALAGCQTPQDNTKYTSETYHWNTPETDKLKLTQSWQGKDFIKDGIGEVTPVRYVDGDTTVFKDASGFQFTVRYNGINTPESTYRIEPWGSSASKYNKSAFINALAEGAKVVLQTEDMSERTDSTGIRYLAWVWFVYPDGDSKLLNLELAELAYAQAKSADGTQYYNSFLEVTKTHSLYNLRVWGEKDPNYDYSTEAKEMTIKEIRETYGTDEALDAYNNGEFVSPLIKVSGIVVRKNGEKNAYIQQYDVESNQYYGIYVYGGYNAISNLIVGCNVQITAKVGYYYGSLQITDVESDSRIKIYDFDLDRIFVTEEEIDNINDIYAYGKIGSLVTIHNLTITSYNDSKNNSSTTLYGSYVDKNGKSQRFNVRIDQSVLLIDPETGEQILSGKYFEGKTFASITGIVTYYNGAQDAPETAYSNGHIQLALTSMDDVVFAE